jgi:hypothetical protein
MCRPSNIGGFIMSRKRRVSNAENMPSGHREQVSGAGPATTQPRAEYRCLPMTDALMAAEITLAPPGSVTSYAKPSLTIVRGHMLGVGAGAFAMPLAAWLAWPVFGLAVVGTEIIVAVAVVFTALYGSDLYSSRAFRLLRWSANRPEPSAYNEPEEPAEHRNR